MDVRRATEIVRKASGSTFQAARSHFLAGKVLHFSRSIGLFLYRKIQDRARSGTFAFFGVDFILLKSTGFNVEHVAFSFLSSLRLTQRDVTRRDSFLTPLTTFSAPALPLMNIYLHVRIPFFWCSL